MPQLYSGSYSTLPQTWVAWLLKSPGAPEDLQLVVQLRPAGGREESKAQLGAQPLRLRV